MGPIRNARGWQASGSGWFNTGGVGIGSRSAKGSEIAVCPDFCHCSVERGLPVQVDPFLSQRIAALPPYYFTDSLAAVLDENFAASSLLFNEELLRVYGSAQCISEGYILVCCELLQKHHLVVREIHCDFFHGSYLL